MASLPAQAQRVAKYGLEHGLSQSSVYTMLHDASGFLWVGTGDGLNRFDGSSFKTYRFSDAQVSQGASNLIGGYLLEDSAHHIWFGTTNGIGRYNFQQDQLE